MKKLILIGVFAAGLLTACFNPWEAEKAVITLNLGGRGRAAVTDEILNALKYTVVLTGPVETLTLSHTGKGAISAAVTPGKWNIAITAHLEEKLFAEGSRDADVKAGRNNVTIQMIVVYREVETLTVNIAAIPGVTAPVTDAVPVTTITETAQYTGTVTWEPAVSATFVAGIAYTATITLTAKEGFTFDGVAANFFSVAGATVTNAANSGVVTAVFPETAAAVTIDNIPGLAAPKTGGTPVTEITATAQYTGTVTWKSGDTTMLDDTTFAPETIYTATITLTLKSGFTFNGVAANFFKVAGAETTNAANSGVVTAVFPETASSLDPQKVYILIDGEEPLSPYNTLTDALQAIKNDYADGDYTLSVGTGMQPQNVNGDTGGSLNPGKNITLTSHGNGEATVQLDNNGYLFSVEPGVTLTLEGNITFKGRENVNNDSALIQVNGGTLYLKNNVTISGNTNRGVDDDGKGGGVSVMNNGYFYMSGGTISGNKTDSYLENVACFGYGGGVYVADGGTFIMSGGTISNNIAHADNGGSAGGGGVYVDNLGIFTMSGGEISGNNTGFLGGGVRVAFGGEFTIEGGEIKGNGNIVEVTHGGGVYVNEYGKFTMHNGIISGNRSNTAGGGVYISTNGIFYKNGGIIYGVEDDNGNEVPESLQNKDASLYAHSIYYSDASPSNRSTTSGPDDTSYQ